jgi:hypothetical protein
MKQRFFTSIRDEMNRVQKMEQPLHCKQTLKKLLNKLKRIIFLKRDWIDIQKTVFCSYNAVPLTASSCILIQSE